MCTVSALPHSLLLVLLTGDPSYKHSRAELSC